MPESPDRQIELLIRERYAALVRAVSLASSDPGVAEDSTQEALARALGRLRSGAQIENLAGWVVVVGSNIARDRRRRSVVEADAVRGLVEDQRRRTQTVADSDDLVALKQSVTRLPTRQRQVTVLYYLLGYGVADVAEILSTSEGNVKNALFKARSALAAALRLEEAADGDR